MAGKQLTGLVTAMSNGETYAIYILSKIQMEKSEDK
ncbi:hypothetical protein BH18THE2_BH18THE2_38290 [soil metagenome]